MLRITAVSFVLLVVLSAVNVAVEVFGPDPGYAIFSAAQKNKPIASLMFRSRVGLWTACPKVNPHSNESTGFPPFNAAIAAHYEPEIDNKLILRVADRLVAIGCSINAYDSDGFTPLHRSIYSRDAAAVRYLLAKNADLSLLAKEGRRISERFVGMSALSMTKSLQSEARTPRDKAELELIEKMLIAETDTT